jgi:hypothetical protein
VSTFIVAYDLRVVSTVVFILLEKVVIFFAININVSSLNGDKGSLSPDDLCVRSSSEAKREWIEMCVVSVRQEEKRRNREIIEIEL